MLWRSHILPPPEKGLGVCSLAHEPPPLPTEHPTSKELPLTFPTSTCFTGKDQTTLHYPPNTAHTSNTSITHSSGSTHLPSASGLATWEMFPTPPHPTQSPTPGMGCWAPLQCLRLTCLPVLGLSLLTGSWSKGVTFSTSATPRSETAFLHISSNQKLVPQSQRRW